MEQLGYSLGKLTRYGLIYCAFKFGYNLVYDEQLSIQLENQLNTSQLNGDSYADTNNKILIIRASYENSLFGKIRRIVP